MIAMPTFVYMTRCDGCGQCVDICPSDIMHIDRTYRRAYNIEPNFCWECYSCVKACPQHAIDVRGYSDFAPLGHKVRVLREEDKGTVSWKIRYRNGRVKEFTFPIRTTPWGSIKSPSDYAAPDANGLRSPLLAHEPEALKVETLPALPAFKKKKG
jgi:adenylylsulfate reductase subunit B